MIKVFALASFSFKTCVRRFSVNQTKHGKVDLTEIKKKQLEFQVDDSLPVYLKGGPLDYALYYATVGLTVLGVGVSLSSLYKLANKT